MVVPNQEIIEKLKRAGKIANDCINYGATLITPGASMVDVLDKVEKRILDSGAGIAFPAQISLNNIAAHYCPTDEEDVLFKEGDMAKLDIGVHIDGYVADTALTVDLGNNPKLKDASKKALEAALKLIKPGVKVSDIGKVIQETIQAEGLRPVKNLSGHGLGHFQIHTSPNIPNIDTQSDVVLEEGMTVAIEPFASDGAGEIFESTNPTIFSLVQNRPVRNRMTREVLKTIQSYNGLPFTTRWLTRIHGLGKTRFALKELEQVGNIITHAPLPDKQGGMVSQHEHSVLVLDEPIVYTRDVD